MNMVNDEISSFGELQAEISLVNRVTGIPSGGTPATSLDGPPDLEESASHHVIGPLELKLSSAIIFQDATERATLLFFSSG